MALKKIALFIDADNISAKFGKQIIDALESRGEIFIRRIYGNWEKNSLHGWNECVLNYSLRAVQQPDFATGKNATDMSLAIDAMDVLYGGKTEIFALVSNDSDFTPLVIRLREGGMKIIGMGNANASNAFRAACDDFICLDAPAEVEIPSEPKKKFHAEKNPPVQMSLFPEENIELKPKNKVVSISERKLQSERDKKIQRLHNVLSEATKIHGDDDGFALLNCAGAELKNKKLGFGVKDFGYATLRNFIADFPKLYELQNVGNIVRYRCLTNAPKKSDDKLKKIHGVLHETAKTLGDNRGFVDLTCAGQNLHDKNLSIKGSGHGTLSKFISAFPNLYEVKGKGAIISYRCL